MKDLFKNKLLWSFVGGVAATVAGSKFAKSDCARKGCSKISCDWYAVKGSGTCII